MELEEYKGFWIKKGVAADRGAVNDREWRVFIDALQPHDVVVDVGAHIGTTTRWFAERASRVIAYEPEPNSFDLLCMNTSTTYENNVMPVYGAVSDRSGYVDLWLSRGSLSHSLSQRRGMTKSIRVPAYALDHLLNSHSCTALKVDAEGAEYIFLNTLKALPAHVRLVGVEVHWLLRTEKNVQVSSPEGDIAQELYVSIEQQGFTFIDGPRPSIGGFNKNYTFVAER